MTDDQRIDKLYESIREADAGISDDAMGEVRRLVALDKAIEVYRIANETAGNTDLPATLSDLMDLAGDIEAFLADGHHLDIDEDADEDDLGGLQ